MSQFAQLIEDLASAIEQGSALLHKLDNEQFTTRFEGSSSVGAHHRHVVEYASLLVDGICAGRVDYDARDRNTLIESNRDAAITASRRLCAKVRSLESSALTAPLEVAHCTSFESDCVVQSTGAREMLFVLSHTIHHWALVRFVLEGQGIEVPPTFGYNPSTLRAMAETRAAVSS